MQELRAEMHSRLVSMGCVAALPLLPLLPLGRVAASLRTALLLACVGARLRRCVAALPLPRSAVCDLVAVLRHNSCFPLSRPA
jgi:hypothetical protein